MPVLEEAVECRGRRMLVKSILQNAESVTGLVVVWPKGLSLRRQCWKQYPAIARDHLACEASEVPGWYHVFKAPQSTAAWKAE